MAAQVRNALVRMGLPAPAALYASNTLGLTTLDDWRDFQTDSDLVGLAKNLRSPGGGHQGFVVSIKTIGNIKIMRLTLKYFQRVQRTVVPTDITMDWIHTWEFLVEARVEAKRKKPSDEDLPKLIMNDWAKTKEKIQNHFAEVFNDEITPLGYIIRDNVEVKPEAEDLQANYNGDHIKELIARAPHEGATYRKDNRTMCRLLRKMCDDTAAYVHVSMYTADGRAAWDALMNHYLG